MTERSYQPLIALFDECFLASERTRLVAGNEEPFYRPAAEGEDVHQIVFAHGFYASALHEVSHWCVAGRVRRQIFDYGYWYEPDGRNADQQQAFERVERKPQALEWLFSLCAGVPFQVSVDNLGGIEVDRQSFTKAVKDQLIRYYRNGLPERAKIFARALCQHYGNRWPTLADIEALSIDT